MLREAARISLVVLMLSGCGIKVPTGGSRTNPSMDSPDAVQVTADPLVKPAGIPQRTLENFEFLVQEEMLIRTGPGTNNPVASSMSPGETFRANELSVGPDGHTWACDIQPSGERFCMAYLPESVDSMTVLDADGNAPRTTEQQYSQQPTYLARAELPAYACQRPSIQGVECMATHLVPSGSTFEIDLIDMMPNGRLYVRVGGTEVWVPFSQELLARTPADRIHPDILSSLESSPFDTVTSEILLWNSTQGWHYQEIQVSIPSNRAPITDGVTEDSFKHGGSALSETHEGVDIPNTPGTNIYSMADGVVVDISEMACTTIPNCRGAFTTTIYHGKGLYTSYSHMRYSPTTSALLVGSYVEAGQMIGQIGDLGNTTGPHLHFAAHLGPPPATTGSDQTYVYEWATSNPPKGGYVNPLPLLQIINR